MNKFKMSTALLLMGFMVAACGEGFKPLTAKSKSVTPQTTDQVVEKAFALADRDQNELFAPTQYMSVQGVLAQYKESMDDLARSIKGLKVQLSVPGSSKTSSTLFSDIFIATGCSGKQLAETKVSFRDGLTSGVDFSGVAKGSTKLVTIGNTNGFEVKMACHDSKCLYANLAIKGQVPDSFISTFQVLMVKTSNTPFEMGGTYIPANNPKVVTDPRFYGLEAYSRYQEGCTGSVAQQQLPGGEANPLPGVIFAEPPANFNNGAGSITDPIQGLLGSVNWGNALGSIGNLFSGDNSQDNTEQNNENSQEENSGIDFENLNMVDPEQPEEDLFADPNNRIFNFNQ